MQLASAERKTANVNVPDSSGARNSVDIWGMGLDKIHEISMVTFCVHLFVVVLSDLEGHLPRALLLRVSVPASVK